MNKFVKDFKSECEGADLDFKLNKLQSPFDLYFVQDCVKDNDTVIFLVLRKMFSPPIYKQFCSSLRDGHDMKGVIIFSKGQIAFDESSSPKNLVRNIRNRLREGEIDCCCCYENIPDDSVSCSKCSAVYCKVCFEKVDRCAVCRSPYSVEEKRKDFIKQISEMLVASMQED